MGRGVGTDNGCREVVTHPVKKVAGDGGDAAGSEGITVAKIEKAFIGRHSQNVLYNEHDER